MKKTILSIALWIVMLAPLGVIAAVNHLLKFRTDAYLSDGFIIICCGISAVGFAFFLESGEDPEPLGRLDKEAGPTRRPL